ncbi:uncharacterized protein LOC115580976 [Sparus aurata]|uniref:uncharacterized protein LOC115580976 n=1 Tax=Sparus aurata TaxID=8175 RepID=UPI0011C18F2F|nr:uncharacterized protein LOC115580976 [Sparus aurata]XP_030271600.1 uncharacterized protein LOC115580976 [Sparus aurata]XP_030271601.1 uncharacterized protein LOC115580976 [Sparus aurata]
MAANHCSCVAGTALCNHTVALLFQTAHYSELKMQVVPPVHSCTEAEQQWHKPRTAGLKPVPIEKVVVTRPKQNRRTEGGIRSILYKGVVGDLLEMSLLNIGDTYQDFDVLEKPLAATMGITVEKTLVETVFGLAQKGSVLSYQQPVVPSKIITIHKAVPPYPAMPREDYRLSPRRCVHVCNEKEDLHITSIMVTQDMALKIEATTRDQAASQEWHLLRKPRITSSHFREVCFVRGVSSAESLAERILKGTRQTGEMRRGADMEFEAIREYCRMKNLNYTPCGLVIHPDAPWLGASPDGLVEVKCPNVKNYVDCKYLQMKYGSLSLRESHAYYWQVQGQLLITGLEWCDFVVFAQEDMLVQCIHVDGNMTAVIRENVDQYYFHVYMQKYLLLN